MDCSPAIVLISALESGGLDTFQTFISLFNSEADRRVFFPSKGVGMPEKCPKRHQNSKFVTLSHT
jgi:hypothetical protein